jgi:hypothetical protein
LKLPILIFATIIALISIPSSAGEVYTYTDEHGDTIISNTPPPRSPKIKIRHIEPSEEMTDEDRQAMEKDRTSRQKAWEDEKARREEERIRRVETNEKEKTEAGKKTN